MENKPVSTFRERPKTRWAWWAAGLGISTVLAFPVLGILASALRPLIDPASANPNRAASAGFAGSVISLLFAVSALFAGITAIRKGERSWMVWVGLLLALLVGTFWILLFVMQFVIALIP